MYDVLKFKNTQFKIPANSKFTCRRQVCYCRICFQLFLIVSITFSPYLLPAVTNGIDPFENSKEEGVILGGREK